MRRDIVLVSPQRSVAVHDHRGSLGCESILVGITADARHAANTEIEWRQFETAVFTLCKPGLVEERDDERAETAVDMETDVVSRSQRTERNDVVLITIREVDGGPYELSDRG